MFSMLAFMASYLLSFLYCSRSRYNYPKQAMNIEIDQDPFEEALRTCSDPYCPEPTPVTIQDHSVKLTGKLLNLSRLTKQKKSDNEEMEAHRATRGY